MSESPTRPTAGRRTTAVVGAGISGLTAAYLLRERDDVTLYEAQGRLGGHAHTHDVLGAHDVPRRIDSGFIVHNERTYPYLLRLLAELDVSRRPTQMSMSIVVADEGLEWAGGAGARSIFAQPRRLADPRFLRMLAQIRRFHRRAADHLARAADDDDTPVGEWLERQGFSGDLVRWYAMPLVACVWSAGAQTARDYPARSLFAFLDNHGMLSVTGSPQWYTIEGGSRSYVDAVHGALRAAGATVRHRSPVTGLTRRADGVTITLADGAQHEHDRVVVATHADEALKLLTDPSDAEREVLGAFRYTRNRATLHTDASILPATPRARASWNYRVPPRGDDTPPVVTYWMNRLHDLDEPRDVLVTLNGSGLIDSSRVLAEMDYDHPVYDGPALRAQRRLPELTTGRTAYAGAHHGWGFHEDGCRSGVLAARAFGGEW